MREVISINIGQRGIETSDMIWKNYCAEHNIQSDGTRNKQWRKQGPTKIEINTSLKTFFQETPNNKFIPRSIMIEPKTNDNSDSKVEDLNNFASGYNIAKIKLESINNQIRKTFEECDNCQGFIFNHCVGEGIGSGMSSLIMENITNDYKKKAKISFSVYPSIQEIFNPIVSYDSLLMHSYLIDHIDVTSVLDQQKLYDICQTNLDIKQPSYNDINCIIGKIVSGWTCSLRFEGELNVDLNELQTNLVPFPKLHFMISSLYPIATPKKLQIMKTDIQSITESIFDSNNFCVKLNDFDFKEDKYMAVIPIYRGKFTCKEVNKSIQNSKKKLTFVAWSSCGFMSNLMDKNYKIVNDDCMGYVETSGMIICNNVSIGRWFNERIIKKYDDFYLKKTNVSKYIDEGMEESEFENARNYVADLQNDYLDVITEVDDSESDY
eukprot:438728_1